MDDQSCVVDLPAIAVELGERIRAALTDHKIDTILADARWAGNALFHEMVREGIINHVMGATDG